MPVLDCKSDGFHERLDSLFDGLLEGPGTGPEWTSLAHHVSAAGTMYVHGGVWKQLSDKLINQLARSVGVSYLQRFEAVRLLLEHRVAHPWLLRATGEFLDDPAVQIVNDPMGVLEVSDGPAGRRAGARPVPDHQVDVRLRRRCQRDGDQDRAAAASARSSSS